VWERDGRRPGLLPPYLNVAAYAFNCWLRGKGPAAASFQATRQVFLNVAAYAFNYWLCIYVIGAVDGTGGSTTTHTFGAFFGAACTAIASPKDAYRNPDCKGRYQARGRLCVC
jgi:hypothetical protein